MKPSKRQRAREEAKTAKRQNGPPKVSKYATKRDRGVVNTLTLGDMYEAARYPFRYLGDLIKDGE